MSKSTINVERRGARIIMTVPFEADAVSAAEKRTLERAAQSIEIKGFRQGHAPVEAVRERIGAEKLREETVHALVRELLPALAKEHNLAPVIAPRVTVVAQAPLTVSIVVIERPKASVKKPEAIKIARQEPKVEKNDVDRVVASVLQQYRTSTPAQRAAKEGDRVTLDFEGRDAAGNAIAGAGAKGYEVTIGGKELVPGFEDALVGLAAGSEKTFTVTMPADYHAAELAGKPVTFIARITAVAEVQNPELTDAFAKERLQEESAAAFIKKVEEMLRGQEEQWERIRRERALLDEIANRTAVDLPDELVDDEASGMLRDIAERVESEGRTLEQWLTDSKKTPKDFEKELRDNATRRIKLRLGIAVLIDEMKIELSDQEMETAVRETVGEASPEDRKSARERYAKGSEGYEELRWKQRVARLMETLLKR